MNTDDLEATISQLESRMKKLSQCYGGYDPRGQGGTPGALDLDAGLSAADRALASAVDARIAKSGLASGY